MKTQTISSCDYFGVVVISLLYMVYPTVAGVIYTAAKAKALVCETGALALVNS